MGYLSHQLLTKIMVSIYFHYFKSLYTTILLWWFILLW